MRYAPENYNLKITYSKIIIQLIFEITVATVYTQTFTEQFQFNSLYFVLLSSIVLYFIVF